VAVATTVDITTSLSYVVVAAKQKLKKEKRTTTSVEPMENEE